MAQTKIGWRPYVSGTDADAQAFITAAAITDSTQQSAINTLVTQLKGYGIWTKMKALYPFVGGSATSHKFNLKDPRDLDAAFRLVFNGGWTHSSTGALPNGTTGYADTYLTPSTTLTSPFLGYYSRSNTNTGYDQIDMGSKEGSNKYLWVSAWYNGSGFSNILARNSSVGVLLNGGPTTDSRGWYWTNKVSTTAKLGKNSTILTSATDTETPPSIPITIGKLNVDVGASYCTNRETSFSVIADGMSDTDTTNFYTAVQTYQSTLGRNVGTPIISDADVQAFITAASITDATQQTAINVLVTDLKSANIWTKMKALYPFVGGSATSHKFNLKDPRDLDVAYRLVFNGGWVHSSNGALPNGTTAYADTKLIPSTSLTLNSTHLSVYLTTAGGGGDYFDMGVEDNSYNNRLFMKVHGSGIQIMNNSYLIDYVDASFSNSTIVGHYINNRTSSNVINSFKNNTKILNDTAKISQGLSIRPLYLAAHNFAGSASFLSPRRQAFASIGNGLTDAEAAAFYTAVQKYQTSLGRQV